MLLLFIFTDNMSQKAVKSTELMDVQLASMKQEIEELTGWPMASFDCASVGKVGILTEWQLAKAIHLDRSYHFHV